MRDDEIDRNDKEGRRPVFVGLEDDERKTEEDDGFLDRRQAWTISEEPGCFRQWTNEQTNETE